MSKKRLADLEIKCWQEYATVERAPMKPLPVLEELKPAA
jgi:hypothetical protein